MTSQIPKIVEKIKLQNFSILRYYSSICATHTRLRCNKLFETAFYSLSVKTFAYHLQDSLINEQSSQRICSETRIVNNIRSYMVCQISTFFFIVRP